MFLIILHLLYNLISFHNILDFRFTHKKSPDYCHFVIFNIVFWFCFALIVLSAREIPDRGKKEQVKKKKSVRELRREMKRGAGQFWRMRALPR